LLPLAEAEVDDAEIQARRSLAAVISRPIEELERAMKENDRISESVALLPIEPEIVVGVSEPPVVAERAIDAKRRLELDCRVFGAALSLESLSERQLQPADEPTGFRRRFVRHPAKRFADRLNGGLVATDRHVEEPAKAMHSRDPGCISRR
jgi:hypothetical protein